MRYLVIFVMLAHCASSDYWRHRRDFIKRDTEKAVGSSIRLNKIEIDVNNYLMRLKKVEFDRGFANASLFNGARYFFEAISDIEQSQVFAFIKGLPKGASLHGHDTGLVTFKYLYNLTYAENLHVCQKDGRINFSFATETAKKCDWKLLRSLRETDGKIDDLIKSQLSMLVERPHEKYPNSYKAWETFVELFETVSGLILYKPIFVEYFHHVLTELYEDEILYFEMRTTLPKIYDSDGKKYTALDTVELLHQIGDDFKKSHPNFIGLKIIYAPYRRVDKVVMRNYIDTLKLITEKYPHFVIGFDLVGEEDQGEPLSHFIKYLKEAKKYTNLYLHAGETNWFGMDTDYNLIDAVLLGAKRIGHGYAITKHPEVVRTIQRKKIAVEIAPISNQVLALVSDLRNHPATMMIAWGLPIVICNDNSSFFGTKALSHDWYMAFMALAGREADLRFLKEIAMNSYAYSALKREERTHALLDWEKQWDSYIKKIYTKINN